MQCMKAKSRRDEKKLPMKLKASLKRHPWRRKKSSSSAPSSDQSNKAAKPLPYPYTLAQTPSPKIDPTLYNELVTPKDPNIGHETPDRSKIVYNNRPFVVIHPSGEELPDDDEFGEVQQVPVSVYYDCCGQVIKDEVWARVRPTWGPPPPPLPPSAARQQHRPRPRGRRWSDNDISAIHAASDDQDELRRRWWFQGHCLRMTRGEKEKIEEEMGCYWLEDKPVGRENLVGGKKRRFSKGLSKKEKATTESLGTSYPLPGWVSGGRSFWQDCGRGMGNDQPPWTAHGYPVILEDTANITDPTDMIWASMCAMYPSVAWESVGVMGGAGEEVFEPREDMPRQFVGTCVSGRVANTPASQHTCPDILPRYTTVLHDDRNCKHMKTSGGMKNRRKKSVGSECKVSPQRNGSSNTTTTTTVGVGPDGFLESSRRPSLAGATLPGHTTAHALTCIDYDTLPGEWLQEEQEKGYDYYNGLVEGHNERMMVSDTRASTQGYASYQPHRGRSDKGMGIQDGYDEGEGRSIWCDEDEGRMDEIEKVQSGRGDGEGVHSGRGGGEGVQSGRVQAIVTCGSLGHTRPATPVSTRALTRAHIRSRTSRRSNSVPGISASSVTSSSCVVTTSTGVTSVSNTNFCPSVGFDNPGDVEQQWLIQQDGGLCEGECTCAMPCKVSGIPVYQGRGGDPPRNPRGGEGGGNPPRNSRGDAGNNAQRNVRGEPGNTSRNPRDVEGSSVRDQSRSPRTDAPPAPPPTGARARGAGRRPAGNNKTSGPPINRSPALVGRRGSFGAPSSTRGNGTQEGEVDLLHRRASLPGPGGGTSLEDARRTTGVYGTTAQRLRTSPSPSNRSPIRGSSPGYGSRAPSPAGKTPTSRRREPLMDNRTTPPSTPLARRPPPRAVYQVRLSQGAASRDPPPTGRDKASSKLPVVASKSQRGDTPPSVPRAFPPRGPSGGGRGTPSTRPGKDSTKDRGTGDDTKGVGQTGTSSLKLDTPPKSSLPLSLSLNAQESAETTASGKADTSTPPASSDAKSTSVATNDDDATTTSASPQTTTTSARATSTTSRANASSFLPKASSQFDHKAQSSLSRSGNNRLTSSASRLTPARHTSGETNTRGSGRGDAKLDRTLSMSSSQITPKTSVTRTFSGPKSSLASNDGANRAKIVRRVMSGSRTNLSKKKSNSKTSLVVGRHNLYNRTKSGSKNSLLGSRNNLFRASLDSQKTESTTDSGCNSPLYGSQCSLDGERKRHSSSPCSNLRKQVGSSSFASRISKPDKSNSSSHRDIRGKESNTTITTSSMTPSRSPIQTPDIAPLASPDPDPPTPVVKPELASDSMGADRDIATSVDKQKECKPDAVGHVVNIVHTHTLSSSHLMDRMDKPLDRMDKPLDRMDKPLDRMDKPLDRVHKPLDRVDKSLDRMSKPLVSVKRSCSLQLPSRAKPSPVAKTSLCDGLRGTGGSYVSSCIETGDDEGKENRPYLPGINVSFRSLASRPSAADDSHKTFTESSEKELGQRDKKEVTKVSIVNEPKMREEKGIQVEASSSEDEYEENEESEDDEGEEEDDEEGEENDEEGEEDDEEEEETEKEGRNRQEALPSQTKSLIGLEDTKLSSRLLPGSLIGTEEKAPQVTPERMRKDTLVNLAGLPLGKIKAGELLECHGETEEKSNVEGKTTLSDEENSHLLQRLETSLADIIDSAMLKNLKINGNILSDQFDAIIATLKKVAASVDAGECESPPLSRRNSVCSGVTGASKSPVSPSVLPLTPTSTSVTPTSVPHTPTSTPLTPTSSPLTPTSASSSSMSPMSPSTPRTPPSKTPLSLFSINECHPGHSVVGPRNRKLSLPRDSLQDVSPTLGELARRLHANPNHLRADQDYVEFMDLDQPYVSPAPTGGTSTNDLIRGGPTPKAYGRKNSTGSLGLSSCASLLEDNSYYNGGPTTTASVTNLNTTGDYSSVFGSQQSAFRKVNSTSNVNGSSSGGSHRLFQRHLSLCGPDDVHAENRLRKSLSKSRELLSQLETEYKKIKGDENKSARNSLVIDQSWLDKDFDELLQTLTNDKIIQPDPHEALAFLNNNNNNNNNSNVNASSSVAPSGKSDKWKASKKDMPPLPSADSPRSRRHHQGHSGSEGRHIFSFFQKKGRSQSLSGTEAIKIVLPVTPEDDPEAVSQHEGAAQGPRRVTYESATLERPGRSNRSNSIPSGAPQASAGSALPLDLVGILRKSRSKSLSKPGGKECDHYVQEPLGEEAPPEEDDEDEPAKQMRSLSLPKSFLSDKYGLTGFKAALPSVVFPWRRGDQNRSSGRSSPAPYDTTNHSPSSSPCYSQSPACGLNEEVINGTCEVAGEVKQKDGVWRRSRGGVVVSRTSRREKASSSPVFRRASLSHSEWDIRRPWSHLYSEREAAKLSQSVCRLAMSGEEGVGGVEGSPDGEDGPRSLPYMPSPTHNTSSEGMFQKFKKSLSLRLTKKGSRSESPGPVGSVGPSSQSAPVCQLLQGPETNQVESQTLPRRRGSISKEEDNKSSFLFGHPLFRSSKERRRARLKDARANKCNSGDSGDSGIELVTGPGHVTVLDVTSSQPPDLDVTAGNYLDPAFVASLSEEGGIVGGCGRELNPRAVRRTHSDVGRSGGRGSVPYCRQLSSPQPLKLRPAHRLPQHTGSLHRHRSSLKRSKGSSHLRRSISQPLDLDKAYDTPLSSLRKCRSPGSSNRRQQRRPSAGNILNDDNTTSEDEIGMSDSEDFRNDLKRSLEDDEDMIVYAEALWDHVTLDSEELVFKAGDLITVIDSSDKDWWWGRISNRAGWFPAAFVRLLVNQEEHQDSRRQEDTQTHGPARKLSLSGLSHDQIRTNVINEIITTERDFVKHLRDVVEGYLRQVRKRPDMFNDEKVSSIFGNMEALYHFQSNFLKELEQCIEWQEPHKSCIGASFIRNREKFEIYSEYCNNHPMAVSSLQELYQDQKYIHFFEACRLLQEMIDISLDGFLLTPVQKICKYPLQLQELLKYTKPDHPDYSSVQGALEAMRDVALLVNERKRRMECLEKIASWQITVEGWEGPELLEESSQLIYQGEATKGAGGSWPKEVTLFLFDHQLVYCKRDLLKRNTFVYRGRLNLDMCEVVDLPDGKDSSLNINAHNAWKIHSLGKNKWYVFSCKTSTEKKKWMEAFRRERELVLADENAGFVVAEKAKHLAKVAARNQKNRPKRPRTTKSHKRVQAMTYAQAELLVNVDPEVRSNSLPSGVQPPEGKKKGMWFSFGGHKKGRGSGRNLSQIQHHPV